ncbi:MAG: ABC transporter permease, partial [Microbacteriaceae bacterium]
MFGTYLRRELVNRRKQTVIIAIGMALAIALVIVVNAVAAGVGAAQAQVLRSVYGVGTDITISTPATAGGAVAVPGTRGPRFDFGAGAGTDSGGSRTIHESRLSVGRTATTMSSATLASAKQVKNVTAAAGILALTNTTFDGTLPDFAARGNGGKGAANPPSGGADGSGGSSFTTSSFSVLGLDPAGAAIGPLSAAKNVAGRSFTSADAGKDVVLLDTGYAKTASLAVGDTTTIGATSFTVIGLVAPTGSDAETAANAYIPLDTAQALSGESGKVSSVYVQAASSGAIPQVKADLQQALPAQTISTQADLAATVSGSLGTAAELIGNLGTVLSLVVLAAAFLIAILFTIAGVTRRTREFGTLKA